MKWIVAVIFLTLFGTDALGDFTARCVQNALRSRDKFVSRHAALRAAKWDARVPMTTKPFRVDRVPMTDQFGRPVRDRQNRIIMTREYLYRDERGNLVVIQEHSAGHDFKDGGGRIGPHFNIRPPNDLRHGVVPGTLPHYDYR